MQFDQRVIIRFLYNEEADAHEIFRRLEAQFGDSSDALRTLKYWIGEIRRGRKDLHDEIRSGRPALDELDARILAILSKSPFESARSIAETLFVIHHSLAPFTPINRIQNPLSPLGPTLVDR
jgi:hypothetical protein